MMALPPPSLYPNPPYSAPPRLTELPTGQARFEASPVRRLWSSSSCQESSPPLHYQSPCRNTFVWESPSVWKGSTDSLSGHSYCSQPSPQSTDSKLLPLPEESRVADQGFLARSVAPVPDHERTRLSHLSQAATTTSSPLQRVPDTANGHAALAPWPGVAAPATASVGRSPPIPTCAGHRYASSKGEAGYPMAVSCKPSPTTMATGSCNSVHFVPYSLSRIHQFHGNVSPLQQNRQRTQPLRDWLCVHRLNPYPNKVDRDLLSAQTGLSPDQVAMWFANTRRRIKKIGMYSWSDGRFGDEEFHAKSLHSISSD